MIIFCAYEFLEQHVEDSSGHGFPAFNLKREREDSPSETFLAGKSRAVLRKKLRSNRNIIISLSC